MLKTPNAFKVKANSTWKDVKDNAKSKITLKENKEIEEWRLNDAQGKVLVDVDKFEKDTTIFAISKEKDVPTPPTNSITIMIEADEGYTFKNEGSPSTIKVDKGVAWSSVKTQAEAKVELKNDYDKTGWKLGGEGGGYIEDTYVFNENQTVFATSKKKGEPDKPKITITVKGDEGVDIATLNTFLIDEGSKWGDVKAQAIPMASAKENFEIASWHLKDEAGEVLKDEKVFDEDATVFATSKRKVVTYKVEHLQENIENDEYTTHETENKEGEAGKNTSAEAKTYDGFVAQSFAQSLIKEDGSTVVKIKYKRKITSLILNLDGGKTTTELEDGKDGNKLLKGKFGAKVEVATPTHDDGEFERWEPPLPEAFPKKDDPTIYVAKWKMQVMRISIKGDERIEVLDPPYIDFPLGTTKTFSEIKEDVKKKVKLKSEWDDRDYEIYDWKRNDYDGDEIKDDALIEGNITVYARTNYAKFKWRDDDSTVLIGYNGRRPRGRIIIPTSTTKIEVEAFERCYKLTAVDFRGCSELKVIETMAFCNCSALEIVNLSRCNALKKIGEEYSYPFCGCEALKEINLTGCSELTSINLSHTPVTSIDLSPCPKLTSVVLSFTAITSIDLSPCPKLTSINLSNTAITNIDLSPCPELTHVDLSDTAITSIDLSPCPKLTSIYLFRTDIASIDLSPCPELTYIGLSNTAITSIDLSSCPKLTSVGLSETAITSIDLSPCPELTYIGLSNTAITSIDLSPCPKLTGVFLSNTAITSIDLSPCPKLTYIDLSGTAITSIDLSPCPKLTYINLSGTAITSIDLSPCPELTNIDLSNTAITSIDLSSCPKIWYINFENCEKLKSVDLSKCTALGAIGVDVSNYSTGTLPFSGCINAEVKLPTSVINIVSGAFGDDNDNYCKEVHVPNETIKKLVKGSGYPEDRIKMY